MPGTPDSALACLRSDADLDDLIYAIELLEGRLHLHAAFADATVELLRGPDESETDEAEAESNA